MGCHELQRHSTSSDADRTAFEGVVLLGSSQRFGGPVHDPVPGPKNTSFCALPEKFTYLIIHFKMHSNYVNSVKDYN